MLSAPLSMTRAILRWISFWLICVGAGAPAHAERLPIRIYTSADGLGSSFVDYVTRDSRGFMWFCTRDGLSRFDGARFITYRVGDKKSPPGIEMLTETRGGVFWITTTGGLYRFKAGSLSRPTETSGGRTFLDAEFVSPERGTILEDHHGTLWYVGQALYRLHDNGNRVEFEPQPLNLSPAAQVPIALLHAVEGPDGSLWIQTNVGLARRLPDGRIVLYRFASTLRVSGTAVIVQRSGRIWVGWGRDIFVIQPEPIGSLPPFTGMLARPLMPASIQSVEPAREIRLPDKQGEILHVTKSSMDGRFIRMLETADGHLWLSSNEELLEFDGRFFRSYGSRQGLPDGMADLSEDAAGNLWVSGQTLIRLDRKGLVSYGRQDGLSSATISAISESADGSLYVSNGNYYLSRFDGARFLTVRPQIAPTARFLWLSRNAVLSTADEWWILTTDGLYRFAAANLRTPVAVYDTRNGLAANEAFQIFEDSRGDIWLSQQPFRAEDFGLYRLKRGEHTFHRFTAAENFPSAKSATSFAEDRSGNLWFGFYEGGLARFANNRFQSFTEEDGLASGLIIDMHLDRKGRLWLASTRDGLSRIDDPGAVRPVFTPVMTTDNGLSSNNLRTITEDRFGNIYVGSVRGVDRISPDRRIRHYTVNDGLASDFVVDSRSDREGTIWFATMGGLSRLWPTEDDTPPQPRVWLGHLKIAGETQPVSALGQADLDEGDLASTRNNLQIDFFGLDFRPGETLRYQFRLDGADAGWSTPTEQRTVTYANLKPGSYRFLVRAVSADGAVSPTPATVSFRILPPLWQRWWFLASGVLLTLLVFSLSYRYRITRMREVNVALAEAKRAEENLGKAREERLAELDRVRTRIATDLHDDIGASLTHIAILSEVAQKGLPPTGASIEPLKSIAIVSNELVDTMSDIVWAINPRKDHLQDLIQRMRRFASDLLAPKGISFEFHAPWFAQEIPFGANPRREVFLIFKESLANIVKHSGAGHVRIDFDFSAPHLTLKIHDDGRGFDAATRAPDEARGGHGVFSMRKRAAEMNATLDIDSAVGKGTTITLQVSQRM
jgi:signal transduction histidine kinase/ligand-binding sensor domain-containing protein